ncbi:hypothetical protein GCM10027020_20380 [Nocardioides salsibiostraticola]
MSHHPDDEDPSVHVLTKTEAASRLGVRRNHVYWLLRMGHLRNDENEKALVDAASVEVLRLDRYEWISAARAAKLLESSLHAVWIGVSDGHITQHRRGKRPSLARSTVLSYRTFRDAETARKGVDDAEQRRLKEPPDTEHVWITPRVFALMAGYGEANARRLLKAGRVPVVQVGSKWWIRRDHAEQLVAARAFKRVQSGRG